MIVQHHKINALFGDWHEIIKIHTYSFSKMHLRLFSGKWGHFSRPQCVKDVTACVWSFALDLTRTKRINVLRPAQIVHNFAVGIFKCIVYHWFSKQNPYFSVVTIISMRCAHANAVSGIYYTKCAKEWHQLLLIFAQYCKKVHKAE